MAATPDRMLNAAEEAARVDRSASAVSRARKDSRHPVNGPHREVKHSGGSAVVRAPAHLIDQFWAGRRAGKPVTAAPPVTAPQARALAAYAAGEPIPDRMRDRLTDLGLINRSRGKLTAAARRLLADQEGTA